MTKPATFSILVVDDEPANIDLLKDILLPYYQVKVAPNGKVALQVAKATQPDLILLDIMMPEMDGFEVCKRLKADESLNPIPVIFVTALGQGEDEERGFAAGGVDYVAKPIVPALVLARIKAHLALANQRKEIEKQVWERTQALVKSQLSAIIMLAEAGHYNDTDTGVHIWRMAAYARLLARAANWSIDDARLLAQAAPMHDTGKIGIPDSILKAPRPLTDEEMTIMRTHTEIGHQILSKSDSPLFTLAAEVAYCHHERWDGTGYPRGLKGMQIPESARIVSIADVFDALTIKRPYKRAWSLNDALHFIEDNAGKHFDPTLVNAFIALKPEIESIKATWDAIDDDGTQINYPDFLF